MNTIRVLYAWYMQKLQTEYIKPTLKESRITPPLQLNVVCYEWDILWLDIWHHRVTTHDQKSLNKIYQRSDERLRHNYVGHQYTNRNTQCFLLHYVKKNLLLKRNLLVSRTQMAANVGVWNLVSCKILAMVATFPVMPRHAITTEM